jgi:hypothetical protein
VSKSAENGFGAASRSVLGDGHASGLPQSHLIISLGGLEVCDAGHRLCDEKAAAKIASRASPNALLAVWRAGMATTSPRRGIFREYRWYKTVAVACCLVPSDSHCVIGSWRILRNFRSEVLGTGAEFSPAEGTANTNKL